MAAESGIDLLSCLPLSLKADYLQMLGCIVQPATAHSTLFCIARRGCSVT